MALTDEEKREARATDPRAAAVIDRVDALAAGAPRPAARRGALPAPRDRRGRARDGRHARTRPAAIAPQTPWWDPGADTSVVAGHRPIMVGGVRVAAAAGCGCAPARAAPTRRTCSCAGRPPRVEAVLFDVDGEHLSRSRWTTTRAGRDPALARPLPLLRAGRGRAADARRREPACWSPASATSSCGDDAFGVEVVRRLAGAPPPEGVEWSTSASAACTWPTSCSTATTCWCWSTPRRAASRRARSRSRGRPGRDRRRGRTRWPAASRPMVDAHGHRAGRDPEMLGSLGGQVEPPCSSSRANRSRSRRGSG